MWFRAPIGCAAKAPPRRTTRLWRVAAQRRAESISATRATARRCSCGGTQPSGWIPRDCHWASFRGGRYAVRRLELDAGDSLVLYSDGITEAQDPAGKDTRKNACSVPCGIALTKAPAVWLTASCEMSPVPGNSSTSRRYDAAHHAPAWMTQARPAVIGSESPGRFYDLCSHGECRKSRSDHGRKQRTGVRNGAAVGAGGR